MNPVKKSRPQSVCLNIVIDATRSSCWDGLIQPATLSDWFADAVASSTEPGAVEFQFGDGDFFVTHITVPAALERLHWQWRFMGVGGNSEIDFHLTDQDQSTRVAVTDQGEYTDGGAEELREGWTDFLSRLKNRIETGERSRYYWSEVISTGLVTHTGPDRLLAHLNNPEIWRKYFPDTRIDMRETATALQFQFHRDAWSGRTTQAEVTFIERTDGTGAAISHDGWTSLPPEIRFAERKHAAGCWARLLADVEAALAYEPCHAFVTAIPS